MPAPAPAGLRAPRRRDPGHDRRRDGLAAVHDLHRAARRPGRSRSAGWPTWPSGTSGRPTSAIAEPMGIPSHRWVRREATGVVGAITPWNVPHQINLAKLGPALAAGNTVVLKPAPDTPWCATVLGRLIAEETDIPAGVVNIVPSADHALGALLSTDPPGRPGELHRVDGHRPQGDGLGRGHASRRSSWSWAASRPSWSSTTPTCGARAPRPPSPSAPTPARGAPSPPGCSSPARCSTRPSTRCPR